MSTLLFTYKRICIFPEGISAMGNAKSLEHDLNSAWLDSLLKKELISFKNLYKTEYVSIQE